MDSPFFIPLAAFAATALIVAIIQLAQVRDKEIEVHHDLYREEMDHRRKMKELETELERAQKA